MIPQLPDGVIGPECTVACNAGHHPDCPHIAEATWHFWNDFPPYEESLGTRLPTTDAADIADKKAGDVMIPLTRDVHGSDLHVGDRLAQEMPDGTVDTHLIDRIAEYPVARNKAGEPMPNFVGDHARIAYGADDRWRHTIADHETFHILAEAKHDLFTPAGLPPAVHSGHIPVLERLVWPAPLEDPALAGWDRCDGVAVVEVRLPADPDEVTL